MKILINEYRSMSANEHLIWDSEIDYYDEDYMADVKANEYQEYLDELDEDEEPEDFETWYNDYVSSMWDADWDMLKDDLESYVLPEINKQINNDTLLLSGSYGSNYPDFRPSGDGGILWDNGIEDLEHFMFDFDRCQITSEDGIVGVHCADHDGTISGQLFTLPDDVTELVKALGYEDEEDFDTAMYYGEIDSRDLNANINLMKPIKDTISGYVQESYHKNKKLSEGIRLNKVYQYEVGILLGEDDSEYSSYNMVYDKQHGFYNEDWGVELDFRSAKKYVQEYVTNGKVNTYGIISEIEISDEELEDIKTNIAQNGYFETSDFEADFSIDSVIYSVYKSENGIIENFLNK